MHIALSKDSEDLELKWWHCWGIQQNVTQCTQWDWEHLWV